MRFAIALFVCPYTLAQAQTLPGCEASARTQVAIEKARRAAVSGKTVADQFQQRLAGLHKLIANSPDDFFVRKAWLEDAIQLGSASEAAVAEQKRLLDEAPNDPARQYLYALSLMGRDTPQSIRLLTRLTADQPQFAWPFATLANIYSYPKYRDVDGFQKNTQTYATLCEASPDAYGAVSRLPDSPFVREGMGRFRKVLRARKDDAAIAGWPVLWQLEFKLTPVAEQPDLRKQVEKDVAALAQLDPEEHEPLTRVLVQGYEITGNAEAKTAAMAKSPGADSAVTRALNASQNWAKEHPEPKPEDSAEKKHAYWEARLKLTMEECKLSDDPFFLLDRARTLSALPEHTDAEFLKAMDQYLAVQKAAPSKMHANYPTVEMMIAGAYVKRGLRLDQVPGLIRATMDDIDGRYSGEKTDLYDSTAGTDSRYASRWFILRSTRGTLLDAYLKLKQFDKAREMLMEFDGQLREWRVKVAAWKKRNDEQPKDKPRNPYLLSAVQGLPADEATMAEMLGRLAKAQERRVDALVFYQSAVRWAKLGQEKQLQQEVTDAAHELWKALGGSSEGWQAWLEQAPVAAVPGEPISRWTRVERPLPEFKLSDINGKTWTKQDLTGKITLVNLWATWCGPCQHELPRVQHLYDRLRSRPDVQVITLSLNDSIGEVDPYMKEKHYTFPALLARDLVDHFLGNWALPQTWLVDGAGVLRAEQYGYINADETEWAAGAIAEMEATRAATAGKERQ
jgi:thiol-disulfide isomerase/thioredoxin